MSRDMKNKIAEAAKMLMLTQKNKKLTVSDIVRECHITRQTFYYHFDDIPSLLKWALEQDTERILQEFITAEDPEAKFSEWMKEMVAFTPIIQKGLSSSYGMELEQIVTQYVYGFFHTVVEKKHLYVSQTPEELDVIIRYNTQAIVGIIRGWTAKDSDSIDMISRVIYGLMSGEITPNEK
jgi:AcrR family transcriptional regulator